MLDCVSDFLILTSCTHISSVLFVCVPCRYSHCETFVKLLEKSSINIPEGTYECADAADNTLQPDSDSAVFDRLQFVCSGTISQNTGTLGDLLSLLPRLWDKGDALNIINTVYSHKTVTTTTGGIDCLGLRVCESTVGLLNQHLLNSKVTIEDCEDISSAVSICSDSQ